MIKRLIAILMLLSMSCLGFSDSITSSKNRLANEDSPYLRLHADNPVNWYPWGQEAFNKAKKENKLIFLSIGYSTCYWCHVMARESFSDPVVADIMNRYYVNIKVDREQRPDVDEVYLTALQLMNGEGGWPVSIFLTPDLKPFFGATYIQKTEFIELLKSIHGSWKGEHRKGIEKRASQVALALKRATQPQQTAKEKTIASPELMQTAVSHYQKLFDPTYGGFQSQPKFPQFPILTLLIADHRYQNSSDSLTMLTKTLDAIMQGGIHDQIGGGLHRYAVDRRWLIPHFEKMLYSQALALKIYSEAYQMTQNESYRYMAIRIVNYLKDKLLSNEGLFFAAEDAQTNQKEGKTYIWSAKKLAQSLTQQEFDFISHAYDLKEQAWGEGKHRNKGIILSFKGNPKEIAKEQHLSLEDFYQKLTDINQKLLYIRNKRTQPKLDTKIITAWNGLTISSLAYAGQVLEDKESLGLAKRAGHALWKNLHTDTVPLYHMMWRGKAQLPAYLDDYAATIMAYNQLYIVSRDKAWLKKARLLADAMIQRLWSPYDNFYYVEPDTKNMISHQQLTFDGARPSANSLAIEVLIKLSMLSGENKYAQYAEKSLKAYSATLQTNPLVLPYMASILYDYEQYQKAQQKTLPSERLYSKNFVKMDVQLPSHTLKLNKKVKAVIKLTIKNGWHINANPASLQFLIPTTIKASLDNGMVISNVDYPQGKNAQFGTGKNIQIYDNTQALSTDIRLIKINKKEMKNAKLTIATTVQACNDKGRCLLPSELTQTRSVVLKE